MADTTLATLGSITFVLVAERDIDLGSVEYEDTESDNIWADINTQLERKSSRLVHKRLQVKLTGATKDELISNQNALRDELRTYPNTLVIQPADATLATTWTVLRNPAINPAFNLLAEYGLENIIECEIVCEPWGYGPRATLIDAAAQESPCLVDLGDLDGQGDPPLTISILRDWGSAEDDDGFENAYVAVTTVDDQTINDFIIDAYTFVDNSDWTEQNSDNTASGKRARLEVDDAWKYLDLEISTSLPPGRYRVLARCNTSSSNSDNYVGLRKQTSTARDPKSKTLVTNEAGWTLYDVGELALYNGFGDCRVYGYSGSGALSIDRVYFIPIDYYWMRYHDATMKTGEVRFGWLYDQLYALTDAAAPSFDATARMLGHGVKCKLDGYSLLVIVERKNGADPTPDFTLTVSYVPRWESFRGV